jgi:hypothetical protein
MSHPTDAKRLLSQALVWMHAQATRGVKSGGAAGVAGGASLFALRDGLTEAQRQELAWVTFAVLRNTNACGVLAIKRGVAWCVAGCVLGSPNLT